MSPLNTQITHWQQERLRHLVDRLQQSKHSSAAALMVDNGAVLSILRKN
jgi:hypothetical protein